MADTTNLTYRSDSRALVPVTTSSDDPEVIRQQIEYTRGQLSTTINEIGDRLSPENLIEQAKTSAKEATVERIKDMTYEANRKMDHMSRNLSRTVRDNPLPVAVIGLGLGWLLLSERSKRDSYSMSDYDYRTGGYRYYEGMDRNGPMDNVRERMGDAADTVEQKAAMAKNRVKDAAQNVGDAIEEAASSAGETVSQTAQRISGTVSDKAEMVQTRAEDAATRAREEAEHLRREAEWRSRQALMRTKQTFWQSMEENPLAIGAVMAIAGAAVGAAIPASEYENRLMGETRDRLVDEAKTRAQDAVERVQTVVEETQRAAVSEAKDSARRQNLAMDDEMAMDNGKENPL